MADPSQVAVDLLVSGIIVLVAGIVGESLIAFIRRASQRAGTRVVTVRLVRQLIRIAWIGLAAVGVAAVWGVTSDLITALIFGILALVVSISLQSTLQNMTSGIFLLSDGVIRVGDRIEHFAIKGVVVRVALRNTWVRDDAGQIAVVGNLKLADGPTLNLDLAARFAAQEHPTVIDRFYASPPTGASRPASTLPDATGSTSTAPPPPH